LGTSTSAFPPAAAVNTPQSTSSPAASLLSGVTAIAEGELHTCALTASGGVKCWGFNGEGQLGNGTGKDSGVPVDVTGLSSGVVAIATGGYHTCALLEGGAMKCWGTNFYGQLGNASIKVSSNIPVDVSGLSSGVKAIAAGGEGNTCALTSGGGVKCWGDNYYGQLGDGTKTNSGVPVDVVGLTIGVTAVSTGAFQTCALTSSGGVKCWGVKGFGEFENGTGVSNVPVDVAGLSSGVVAIAAGENQACALLSGGGVKCWGENDKGQLGNGTTTGSSIPVDAIGLTSGVTAIATSGNHTCALLSSGGVKCWGWNSHGQLGNGTTQNSAIPVEVNGLSSGVTAIATGGLHSCALMSGGGVKCWGLNAFGALGDGTIAESSLPVDVIF
jgi:alpha-tubulin suppressor-like RCC1 family protein